MNRNIEIFFVSLCGILFLLLFTALLLPIVFNPKYHKSSIESYLSSLVGLPCSLEGRVEFSLIPQTSITFSKLTVGNPDGFDKEEFLFFESGQVLMGSLPFFKGSAELKRVMLTGARATFVENEQGIKNWSYLTSMSSSLAIDLLVVTDGDVVVERKPSKRQYRYSDMSLVLSDYSFNKFSGFETEGFLNELELRLDGRLKAITGDAVGQTKIFCKGDLSLRANKADVDETATSPVFIGTMSGDIVFPEGEVDLSLVPHSVNKNRERVGDGPIVDQLFQIKGSFSEPVFLINKDRINEQALAQSSINSTKGSIDSKVKSFARMLNGGKDFPKREQLDRQESENVSYSKSKLGSIKIGVMQVQ